MIRNIFLLVFLLIANVAHSACDSTTNGYFCLPQQGTSGAAERLKFFNSLQFADGIIGLMRSANYWTNGVNSTLAGETDLESADLDITGSWNFSAGKLMNPKGTTLPTTDCDASGEAGRIFIKTNAPTGQQLYVCEGLAGWVLSSGSGSGGIEWQNDGSVIFSSPSLGNVGIGTVNPQHTLEVSGTANITNALTVNNKDVCLEDGTNCVPSDAFDSTAFKNINWDNPGLLTPGTWTWNTGATKPSITFGNGIMDFYNTVLTVHGTTSQIKGANNMFWNFDTARQTCLGSTGGTYNENMCFDNDTTSNTLAVLSGTGATLWDFQSISLKAVNITASGNVTAGTTGTSVNVLGSAGNISVGTEYVTGHVAPLNGGIVQGNFGIGTFSPTAELQVAGSVKATSFVSESTTQGSVVLSEASANGSNTITITAPSAITSNVSCALQDDSTPFDDCVSASGGASGWTDGGTNVYTTETTDNVGIGTFNPTVRLQVGTTTASNSDTPVLSLGSTISATAPAANKAKLLLYDSGTSSYGFGITAQQLNYYTGASNADHVFLTQGTELARIRGNGNVGIGTTTPSQKLQVVGGARITALVGCDSIDSDANGTLSCGTDDGGLGAGGWIDGGASIYNETTSDIVGIGTTTPTAQLLVENLGTVPSFRVNDSATDSTPFIIDSIGNVGIGTTTASGKLTIGSTGQFSIDGSGNFSTSSTTGSTDTFNIVNNSLTSANIIDASSSSSSQTAPLVSFTQSGASSGGTLRVNQSSSSSTGLAGWITNAGTGGTLLVEDQASDPSPFRIDAAGNVGIGTNNPIGDFNIFSQKATTGTRYLCIDTNGAVTSSASACSGT